MLKVLSFKRIKLEVGERDDVLFFLKKVGWIMVEGRDVIYKEFLFKDFNEVIVYFFFNYKVYVYFIVVGIVWFFILFVYFFSSVLGIIMVF